MGVLASKALGSWGRAGGRGARTAGEGDVPEGEAFLRLLPSPQDRWSLPQRKQWAVALGGSLLTAGRGGPWCFRGRRDREVESSA